MGRALHSQFCGLVNVISLPLGYRMGRMQAPRRMRTSHLPPPIVTEIEERAEGEKGQVDQALTTLKFDSG